MEQSETNRKKMNWKPLSAKELEVFCEKLSMIVRSGMMVHDGVKMMANDTEDRRMKEILQEVAEQLEQNEPLENALKATGTFPEYMVHMVAIGSESGRMEQIIDSLAVYYKNQNEMKENLKSAVTYPAVLVIMMLAVLIFLSVKVLPVFEGVFRSLGAGLSPQAAFIMRIGGFLSQISVVLLGIVVLALIIGIFLGTTKNGKKLWGNWVAQRRFSEKFAVSAFASSLALMLSSGLNPPEAVKMASQLISSHKVKKKTEQCLNLLEGGEDSFMDAMEKSGIFTNTANGILAVGSASGSVDAAMRYVAQYYEEEFWHGLTKKISWIEPAAVAILSILVGIILISVMLPLLGVMSSIG